MSILTAQKWGEKSYEFFSKRVVYHSFIWATYMLILLLLDGSDEGFGLILRNTLIHVFFLILIVYFNYLYLIPRFLSKKYFIIYLFLIIFTAVLVTPIEIVCLYWNIWENGNINTQIELLEKQSGHFIFIFSTLIISTLLKITKEWFFQQAIQKDLENKNLQSELSFLKSQINPHFLFNTLNNIYALSLKKSDKAPEIVLRLSEMMRYMLYKSNEKKVPLEQEIQYIQNYLALEKTRYGNKAKIEFECTGDSPKNYNIVPLLFITFLENSFKHGLSQSITEGFVICKLHIEKNRINFQLENSKTTEKDDRYFQGGIGLKNVKRRLELLYNSKFKLHIQETKDIYTVNLKIDLDRT
ncbi:MAG: histidine kinase [Saprospiraceae bacterium]|nr:histidine kinase [Saprospiraceae bacterium]